MKSVSLQVLAAHVNGFLIGEEANEVNSVAAISDATKSQVTFLNDKKYKAQLADCQAGLVLIRNEHQDAFSGNKIICDNPYYAYALIAQLLDNSPELVSFHSDNACIAESANVDASARIAANAVIDEGAQVGANCMVASGAYVGKNVTLGKACKVYANASIYHNCVIGNDCIIHSGAVIGSDGFGFANDKGQWVKIPQVGRVVIGNEVEVGSNTSIDCGTIKDTIIHDGVKIDNLVHIAHNVEVDENTAIAGGVIMAGSTYIGKRCTLAGGVALNGHIRIADDVHITGFSMVTKSIKDPGVYSSGIPATNNRDWRKNTVKLRQVDSLFERVKELEKQLALLDKK